jgi:hypothetical protein
MVLSISIPVDIIGSVIEQLQNDSDTLKTTAVVSRSFLRFSQRYLFSTINLSIGYRKSADRERSQRLQYVFASNPKLASYVRDFSLSITGLWHPETMTYPQSLLISNKVLPQIFGALERLHSFTLSGLWEPQTTAWKSAVFNLCRSPSLRCLCLRGTGNFPVAHIAELRQIQRLALWDTTLKLEESKEPGGAGDINDKGWLEVLEFDVDTAGVQSLFAMLMRPQSILNISQLRVLRLTGTNSIMRRNAWDLLQAVSGSLECLIWEHMFSPVVDLLVDSNHCM